MHSGHIQALVCQFSYSYWGGPALSPALHCQHKRCADEAWELELPPSVLPSLHQLRVMPEGEEKGKWNCESQFAPAKSTPIEESALPQYDAQKSTQTDRKTDRTSDKPTPNETKTDRSTQQYPQKLIKRQQCTCHLPQWKLKQHVKQH